MSGYILGITGKDGFTHDNSVAIVKDGQLLFAASEERYSRIKHDGSYPSKAMDAALEYLGLKPSDIETMAIGYPPRKNFSVLKHRYFYEVLFLTMSLLIRRNVFLFGDFVSFIKILKSHKRRGPKTFEGLAPVSYVDHHLAHAASAYYTSGFEKCLTLVLDAFGSDLAGNIRCGAAYVCKKGKLEEVMSFPIYTSLGLFYQSVTLALGFTPGDGEGKTMGFAAYGDPSHYYSVLRPYAPSFENGNWRRGKDWLSNFFSSIPKLKHLFRYTNFGATMASLSKKQPDDNIAAAAQKIAEEELIKLISYLFTKFPQHDKICLAGGLFLNVKANKYITELPFVKSAFVHPHAGDGGTAVGSALYVSHTKDFNLPIHEIKTCGLGSGFTNSQIEKVLQPLQSELFFDKKNDICDHASSRLIDGKVIGWFQGRAEWGPRALGFRSVLADPRHIEVKDRINSVLKNREWFMPFAPSILEEQAPVYFKNCQKSPFMTFVFDVVSGKENLVPAAIHIDRTARPNTVSRECNPLYYDLINAFFKKTGLPVILNTSFNLHGLPVVNSPQDAVDHLLWGAIDELIIGDYAVTRKSDKIKSYEHEESASVQN